ncbi:hypothetical protein R1sor_022844 [Riccia sorocarpa]|uniref:Protein SERAC1 n=1 Tax=Riccia sorocarpa TaxID=122646 RepID=A0ABD3GL14_9MARC
MIRSTSVNLQHLQESCSELHPGSTGVSAEKNPIVEKSASDNSGPISIHAKRDSQRLTSPTVLQFGPQASGRLLWCCWLVVGDKGIGVQSTHQGESKMLKEALESFMAERTDAVYRVYDGNRKGRGCQIVFLHGLQVNHEQEEDAAYLRKCWSSRDGCELWPKWLAGCFPSASIYLVKYDSRLHEDDKNKQRDMHITAEGILSDLLLANIGQSPKNPVILVGQDIGGLVIKTICLLASRHLGEEKKRLFSQQVKGIVYYSTPHLGVRMEFGDCELDAKLAKVLTIHNAEIVRSNEEFRRLRGIMNWSCIALWASHVDTLNVEEGTARFDVDIFCPIDCSAMDICHPEDRSSSSFGKLAEFIRETLNGNRNASRPKLDFKEDPKYVPLRKTSNKIRSLLADPERQVVVLVGDAGTGKSGVAKYLALQYDMETGPEAEFLDGVFCVDCGRGANAVPILRRLLRQMKVLESIIGTTEDVDSLTYLLKEKVQDLSALMIFDDVSGDDRNSLVEKLVIPSAEDVKYLFTTQESRGWHGYSVEKIEIITDAVAEEIMAKRIGLPNGTIPEADKGIVLEIIKATDFHPLALASVAAAVQTNDKGGVDPSEWKEVKENLLFYLTDERGVDAFGKSYLPRSVFAAMMFAVQVLHREDKILFEALCILALFEGPFPKKVPLLLLLSIKSTLSRHLIRFMKELESRGFVERTTISAESDNGHMFYYGDICVSVPSCKMHSLRQQFMLLFLREDVASFGRSSVEFRDSVDAVQEIISPFLNEASEGRNSNTTVASMSAALCSLYGAKDVKEKALSRLPKVADLLFPDHILKANLGMLMMDIAQDTDSVFLLEVQRVVWKYIVDGEIDDVSMANLIGRHDHKALLFFTLHVLGDPFPSKSGGRCSMANRVLGKGFSDWVGQQVSSNRKSVEAVFRLLTPSCSTTEAEFQVQMFALQLLGRLRTRDFLVVFRGILVSDPAIVDSIRRIVTKLGEYVNASPLVVPKMESTEVDILRGEDAAEFQRYFEAWWYSKSSSLEMNFRDSIIRPVQTILYAVRLLDIHQSLDRDETGLIIFDEGLALMESISEPLLCIARILGQRMTRKSSTLHSLALSVLSLIVRFSCEYTDKRGRSSMDFMPNALESMVAEIGVEPSYDRLAFIVLRLHLIQSSFTTISRFIPKLAECIRKGWYNQHTLEDFLDLFKEGHDMTGICSADRQDLSEALFTVLGRINETQGVKGRTELRLRIWIYLLLLGHPQEYRFDSCVGIRAIQLQLRQSMDAESRATELLDGFHSLFDIIKDSQCESVKVEALVIMALILKQCPKVGARSIFWGSRAVETLAPLLEEHDEQIQALVLNILLSMPSPETDTSYRPPNAYSCMRHIASISGVPMHIFRYFKHHKIEVGQFFTFFLDELKEDGVPCLLDIPDLLEDIVCVLREESKQSWGSRSGLVAISFLYSLVRYDRSHRVCSQLVTLTESIEMLVIIYKQHDITSMFDVRGAISCIFSSFTSEQVRAVLTNPAVKEVMQSMTPSLQNSGQSIVQISSTLQFLVPFVEEVSDAEHVLSFPGAVEALVGFLISTRKEQVECSRCSLIGIEKKRKVLAEAICYACVILHGLVRNNSQQERNRIFGISGFVDLMIDLFDEDQDECTQDNVLGILKWLSHDPEQQDQLHGFRKNRFFCEKCSKLLLGQTGRRPNTEAGVRSLCRQLSLRLGNKEIIKTVQSLVSRGLRELVSQLKKSDEDPEQQAYIFKLIVDRCGRRELVSQLKKSDEDPEQQAFLFKLIVDRYADGWVGKIQIGDYFLGAAQALDRLVDTSVYCKQESLRADALEILGICVCILEDGKNPLQIGESRRQQQLQMILQAVPAILDQIPVGGCGPFLRFLRRLGVECKQSSTVILKDPNAIQSLIMLSTQDADQEAKGDALDCLQCFVLPLSSRISDITREGIYLLQELSKALALIACGTGADNSMRVQNTVVALLRDLMEVGLRKDLDESTGSLLSAALESKIVGDIHVLENLVALLERDEPDVHCEAAIDILLYAGEKSATALDHIAQLPRALERLVELFCGAKEGRVQQVAFRFLSALIQKTTCKIRARASCGLLMCLVHVVSTKVGEEIASRAVRLLVLCAAQNNKALGYLTSLLGKPIRSVLNVDATVFLIKQMSESAGDSEQPLLMSLQTTWVRCFPGKDWESYFPGEECSDSVNLEPRVLAGLMWLSEISLRMQLRIAESLTGIHAGDLLVVEKDFGDGMVSQCMSLLFLVLLQFLVLISWR